MKIDDWNGNGNFGCWEEDSSGAPSYVYRPSKGANAGAVHTTEKTIKHSPWHQAGNRRVSALAHADGYLQLYSGDRGLSCITPYQPLIKCSGGGLGCIEFSNGEAQLLRGDALSPGNIISARFGLGYCEYAFNIHGAEITIKHWAPDGDLPVIISDISIDKTTCKKQIATFSMLFSIGYWFVDMDPICSGVSRESYCPPPLGSLLSFATKNVLSPLSLTTDCRRADFARSFKYKISNDGFSAVRPRRHDSMGFDVLKSAARQREPMTFFAHSHESGLRCRAASAEKYFDENCMLKNPESLREREGKKEFRGPVVLAIEKNIDSAEARFSTRIVWGYAGDDEIPEAIKAAENSDFAVNISRRMKHVVRFLMPGLPWVEREWIWNSDYTRNSASHDKYTNTTCVKQASAYWFVQGVEGTTRDHALFAVPMIYVDPGLARGMLEYTMKLCAPDGRIPYGVHGYGITAGFGLHDWPTDLPLAFLWAMTEYIFATRDFDLLDERFSYYPRNCGKSREARAAVEQTCEYLMETIGAGPNGLMRVGTGDWNDPLQLHVRNRNTFFKRGESVYNTAMAVYVLPRVAQLIGAWNRELEMRITAFALKMKEALQNQWNGKWLYRAWDGAGRPLGRKSLYLEHCAWALVARALPDDMLREMTKNIEEQLDAPSPVGAMVLHPPKKVALGIVPRGWDTNGGVWHATNVLLTWGYGRIDPRLARNSLLKNSLAAHAEAYPDIWYGIWSGPDSYNAHYAEFPGETFSHFTPMADFPVMNSNAHANQLTAAIKLCGIEPSMKGFRIEPLLPDEKFSIRTPLISIEKSKRNLRCIYNPGKECGEIEFIVKDAICAAAGLKLLINGKEAVYKRTETNEVSFAINISSKGKASWALKA